MLKHGDFNIIDQENDSKINWLATSTGADPTFQQPAISVYLAPFYAYQLGVAAIRGYNVGQQTAFSTRDAHVCATIVYVLFGFVLLSKVFTHFALSIYKVPLVFFALGTSFLWYFLFCSTNPNIFGQAYASAALAWFLIVREKPLQRIDLFFMGVIAGLGFVIRVELLWLSLLSLYLYSSVRGDWVKRGLVVALGTAVPFILFWVNSVVRGGNANHPALSSFIRNEPIYFMKLGLYQYLFGPNGYFVVSPIYLVGLIAFVWVFLKKREDRVLWGTLSVGPILFFFAVTSSWMIENMFVGRHQLEFFPIWTLMLGLFFQDIKNSQRLVYRGIFVVSLLCVLWAVMAAFAFSYADTQELEWPYLYYVNPAYWLRSIQYFIASHSLDGLRTAFVRAMPFVPLLLVSSLLLQKVVALPLVRLKKPLTVFFVGGLCILGLFTGLNFYNHPTRVKALEAAGFYRLMTIGKTDAIYAYDDFVEMYYRSLRVHLNSGNCEAVSRLDNIFKKYVADVKSSVLVDPHDFVANLNSGKLKRTNYLSEEFISGVERDKARVCIF